MLAPRAMEGEACTAQRAPSRWEARLEFTGDGAEYFRIWVVNLLFSFVTLGIYSAWAKARKTRYFWLNTRLEGFAFDYHGNPGAILRGRLVALVLLAAYTWTFQLSVAAGVVTICLLCALGPWLFMKAQQFKLRSTSYRGVRFEFDADIPAAYKTILPVLLVWFSTTILSVAFDESAPFMIALGIGVLLSYPWMHHTLKRYQHSRAGFGGRTFRITPDLVGFYGVYLLGFLLFLLVGVLAGLMSGILITAVASSTGVDPRHSRLLGSLVGGFLALSVYTFVWPYMAARLQKIVWESTRWGDTRFRNEIAFKPLAGVVLRNVVLTLLTLGLYWPFAAVALARYRVESLVVVSKDSLGTVTQEIAAPGTGVTGEGAADLFGLDIGL